jgi:hypothetical protein
VTTAFFEEQLPTILHARFVVAYAKLVSTEYSLFQLLSHFIKIQRKNILLMKGFN